MAKSLASATTRFLLLASLLVSGAVPVQAGRLDSETAAAGLREALRTGTSRAVDLLGSVDGYLKNPQVHIPVPEKFESIGKAMRKIGLDSVMDEFETGMNRAAEAAAPLAKEVFVSAIKEMTIADALDIVRGDEHAATDYLRLHAGEELGARFRPIVSEQLAAVGATRAFDDLMDRAASIPFLGRPGVDLEVYVTDKALDGMFLMIATEEQKIREDPLARTSDLLKTVFGGDDEERKVPWWKRLLGD